MYGPIVSTFVHTSHGLLSNVTLIALDPNIWLSSGKSTCASEINRTLVQPEEYVTVHYWNYQLRYSLWVLCYQVCVFQRDYTHPSMYYNL